MYIGIPRSTSYSLLLAATRDTETSTSAEAQKHSKTVFIGAVLEDRCSQFWVAKTFSFRSFGMSRES